MDAIESSRNRRSGLITIHPEADRPVVRGVGTSEGRSEGKVAGARRGVVGPGIFWCPLTGAQACCAKMTRWKRLADCHTGDRHGFL